jgi:MFS family permease
MSAAAYVAIARGYPEQLRARMLAIISSAWVLPGIVGPAVAAAVADQLGWRWVFLGLTPPTVAAALLVAPVLRVLAPSATSAASGANVWPALRLVAGVACVLGGIASAALLPASGLIALGLVVAVPAATLLVPPVAARAQYAASAAVATTALVSAAFFGTEVFVPLSLTAIRGQGTVMAGLTLTAAALSWTTGAWIQARVAPRQSRRRVTMTGVILIVMGIGGIAACLADPVPVWVALVSWGVAGLGMGLAFSTAALVVLESAEKDREGAASSALQLADVLGAAVGTGLAGAFVQLAGSGDQLPRLGLLSADVFMALAALGALIAARRLPGAPAQPQS